MSTTTDTRKIIGVKIKNSDGSIGGNVVPFITSGQNIIIASNSSLEKWITSDGKITNDEIDSIFTIGGES